MPDETSSHGAWQMTAIGLPARSNERTNSCAFCSTRSASELSAPPGRSSASNSSGSASARSISTSNVSALSSCFIPCTTPGFGAMSVVSAPAATRSFRGSTISICSKSSVTMIATRRPFRRSMSIRRAPFELSQRCAAEPMPVRGLSFASGDDVAELTRLVVDERRVAWITLTRPDVKNAFNAELIAQLSAAADAVPAAARCVVLASEGDTFCAGADLGWMRSMADYTVEENVADSGALADMYATLDALPMPIIARIQGPAIGGGAGLVAVADIAVAVEAATFAFTEVRLGILPAVISPYVVRKVGLSFATPAVTPRIRLDSPPA